MALKLRLPRPRRPVVVGTLAVLAAVVVAAGFWLIGPFWQLSGQFGDRAARQPSRLYARPAVLAVDRLADADALVAGLLEAGYRESSAGELGPGQFHRGGDVLTVRLRPLPTPSGPGGDAVVAARFRGRRVAALTLDGRPVTHAALDPPLLATYYGDRLEERRPVSLGQTAPILVDAILAAEDAGFFRHPGISPSGVLRAIWSNTFGGGVRQGGSTLTQQLVKNLYLTHERTLSRKAREAVLALLLEARYEKREILEAYLNEIYLGARQGVNLIGVGAASWAYFSKRPEELNLGEAATLAGIIPAPASFSPVDHPDRARERRDLVLRRLAELGKIDPATLEAALARPVEVRPAALSRRRAPYFADAAAREAVDRFGVGALADAGYTLLATVDRDEQMLAEETVAWGLAALEQGWERRPKGGATPLQAALVSADPATGEILAYVGGRDYSASQFDRAGQARRQAGSAFKPVVYAAAFEDGVAAPSSLVEDAPLTVTLAGRTWEPQNSDQEFRGWVTARTALEQSLNVATARVALQTGLPRIVEVARALGVEAPLEPVPALALGAFELSAVEMATVYAAFAAGGLRPELHGLAAVLDPSGAPVPGTAPARPEPAISPETAYLVTSMLEGVLVRGTGAAAQEWGLAGPLAGKTGTTNSRRDSWFAGYSADRVSVVWVGYDDNAATNLSGTRAALPIWVRFTARTRPAAGWSTFRQPAGIVTAVVDPQTGELATEACPETATEVFRAGQVPDRLCHLHDRPWADPWPQPEGVAPAEPERAHPFRRWLRRVFRDDPRGR